MKPRITGHLDKLIAEHGYEEMKRRYLATPIEKFRKECHCSATKLVNEFGQKGFRKMEYVKRDDKVPTDQNIRAGINTHRWQYPKENRYWEKIGEVKSVGYLKTSLLP